MGLKHQSNFLTVISLLFCYFLTVISFFTTAVCCDKQTAIVRYSPLIIKPIPKYNYRLKMLAQEVCFYCGYASFVSYVLVTTLSWLLAVVYLSQSILASILGGISTLLTVVIAALYLLFNKRGLHPVCVILCLFGILNAAVAVLLIITTVTASSQTGSAGIAIAIG